MQRQLAETGRRRAPAIAARARRASLDDGLGAVFRVVDDRPGDAPPSLRAYEAILAIVVAVEYWLRAVPRWGDLPPHYFALIAVVVIACPLTFTRARRSAFAVLAISRAALVWTEFPAVGNHAYLEILLCAVAAFLDPRKPDEARLYTRAVRVMAVIVLAYSGIQKLAHGYYRHGEYLAYRLRDASFRPVLRPLLSSGEYDRLTALTGAVGSGSYRVRDPWFVAIANATWMAEIGLAVLLCIRRSRRVAVAGAVALLLAIEAAAREVSFGLVFADAILLFAPATIHRAALPFFCALLVVLVLSRLGAIPAIAFY